MFAGSCCGPSEFVRLKRLFFPGWAVGVQRFSRETAVKFSCPV